MNEMDEMALPAPTKSTAVRVSIVCLFAIITAVVLFIVGIQKNELWCCPVAIIAVIAMVSHTKDVWSDVVDEDANQ